ncbi:MAG TPA: hypothetical protein VEI97_06570 [bacterium]|nr:hypothetical protein [bacterium]
MRLHRADDPYYDPRRRPPFLREGLISILQDQGFSAGFVRSILCKLLRRQPDSSNWSSEYIWAETASLLDHAAWFKVYDFIEKFNSEIVGGDDAIMFATEVNDLFMELGIGWQLENGQITTRGDEAFESTVTMALQDLQESGKPTAARELQEAVRDLSRRPDPDLTGAIHHAMGALECLARELSGRSNDTLGQVLKSHGARLGIPPAVVKGLESWWGYASETSRHLSATKAPARAEAEFLVAQAASVLSYLLAKAGLVQRPEQPSLRDPDCGDY